MQGAFHNVVTGLNQVLEAALVAVDADDAALAAVIPSLVTELRTFQQPIRQVSVGGVQLVDAATEQQRTDLAAAIREFARISILMIVLIATVAIFVFALFYLLQRKTRALVVMGENLALIQDVAFDAIVVTDAKGRIVSFNTSAERMFKMRRKAAIGEDFSTLVMREPAASWLRDGIVDYKVKGSSSLIGKLVALQMHDSSGLEVPVEGAFMTGTNVDGSQIVVACLRDVRERLESEAELSRALVSARIGEETKRRVITVLGHELRTALNGVIGSITLLANSRLDPTNRESTLKSARITALDALRIADNALESSKLDASENGSVRTEHYDLRTLIERIASQHADLAAFHGTQLTVELGPSTSSRIVGDEHLISLAVGHLLHNAIRFTGNGKVVLSAELIQCEEDSPIAEIRVRDNGCGISQTQHSKIFEDFETFNDANSLFRGGAGLGLGIVARAVNLLEGEISLSSAQDEGSEFCIRYPAVLAEPRCAPNNVSKFDENRPMVVLVVDDNAINRQVLCAMLHLMGVSVDEAADGQEAVDMANRVTYDVIIMDIAMPHLDGREATRRIRHSGPSSQAVIVGLTAHVRPEDHHRLIQDGMNEVLAKPLSQSKIARLMDQSLDQRMQAESGNDALLTLVQTLGGERVRKLVDQFATEATDLLDNPGSNAADTAHSIAGAAALFGFDALRACFLELEGLFESKNERSREAIADTRIVLFRTLNASDQFISRVANSLVGD